LKGDQMDGLYMFLHKKKEAAIAAVKNSAKKLSTIKKSDSDANTKKNSTKIYNQNQSPPK
jgi:hypothetical protein